MLSRKLVFGLVATALSLTATETSAQVTPRRILGKIVEVKADNVVLEAQGARIPIQLQPGWTFMISSKTSLAAIKPGSFIGTTNVDIPGGGRATEVHIFPPGVKIGEGQRVMDAGTSTRMTNATVKSATRMTNATVQSTTRMTNAGVKQVSKAKGGTIIELAFPGGTRRVVVPADALITELRPAPKSLFKPGTILAVSALPDAQGKLSTRYVTTGPNGTAPAR